MCTWRMPNYVCTCGPGEAFWQRRLECSPTSVPVSWSNKESCGSQVAARDCMLLKANVWHGSSQQICAWIFRKMNRGQEVPKRIPQRPWTFEEEVSLAQAVNSGHYIFWIIHCKIACLRMCAIACLRMCAICFVYARFRSNILARLLGILLSQGVHFLGGVKKPWKSNGSMFTAHITLNCSSHCERSSFRWCDSARLHIDIEANATTTRITKVLSWTSLDHRWRRSFSASRQYHMALSIRILSSCQICIYV